jgi:hypothetical protein
MHVWNAAEGLSSRQQLMRISQVPICMGTKTVEGMRRWNGNAHTTDPEFLVAIRGAACCMERVLEQNKHVLAYYLLIRVVVLIKISTSAHKHVPKELHGKQELTSNRDMLTHPASWYKC